MERYTKDYLNYIKETKDIDMSEQYELFMKYVPKGSKILDAGFGSGRDIAFFKQYYDVTGIDLSSEFVSYVKENIHPNVYQMDILNLKFDEKFDAIWACASLVHFSSNEFINALDNIYEILNDTAILYISLKEKLDQTILLGEEEIKICSLSKNIDSKYEIIKIKSSYSPKNRQNWCNFILRRLDPML